MKNSLSVTIPDETYEYIKKELKRRFPQYEVTKETRKRRALVLIRTSEEDKISTKGGQPKSVFTRHEVILRNTTLEWLVDQLNHASPKYWFAPIINKTGYAASVDITLKADISDEDSLKKALRQYDLDLVSSEQEVEVLVIREKMMIGFSG